MRWRHLRRSGNVRDARSTGMGMRLPMGGGAGGVLGTLLLLGVVYLVGGPQALLMLMEGGGSPDCVAAPRPGDDTGEFVAAILGSTEDVWSAIFQQSGRRYEAPELEMFSGAVRSACGLASAASGPFYCPADRRTYLDTTFFTDLARMGGPGDFAAAYVIGHEIGHHVQNLLGVASRVREAQSRGGETEANRLQVAMELQADCYAGVWAHHANRTQQVLEPGDIDEGLAAAEAIGDDRLQKSAGRTVTPDSFTHGSSEQRQHWLATGLRSGNPADCDTFD